MIQAANVMTRAFEHSNDGKRTKRGADLKEIAIRTLVDPSRSEQVCAPLKQAEVDNSLQENTVS